MTREALPPEVVKVLEERAERLRAHGKVEEETELVLTAEFAVGDELFAFPLERLRGVVPLSRVTRVPLSAPEILGVVRFHGQLVTSMSLPALLGGRAWTADPSVLLVAEPTPGVLVGIDCEQVPRPGALARRLVEDARSAAGEAPWLEVQLGGGRQLNLLVLERLLARREVDHG
ncbi:MAG: chemotaxis protein CheW [Myxococcota bacterium]